MPQFKKPINQMTPNEINQIITGAKVGSLDADQVYELAMIVCSYSLSMVNYSDVAEGTSLTAFEASNRVLNIHEASDYLYFIRPWFASYPVITKHIDQINKLLDLAIAHPNLHLNVTGNVEKAQ